jgi:DNA replication and repair protein RecF
VKIQSIKLKNFRSHKELNIEFTDNFIVFYGPNASGKTNILESIYFLSIFKSFRDAPEHLFLKGTFAIEMEAKIEKGGENHVLEVFLENRAGRIMANFRLDGVRKSKKLVRNFLSVVMFEPQDVNLMVGPSDQRRRYLNMVLSQKDSRYLDNLYTYKKILSQKNELLYKIQTGQSSVSELQIWNEQQAVFGSEITLARREYLNFLNAKLPEVFYAITGFNRPIEVFYKGVPGDSLASIGAQYKKLQYENQEKEITSGVSIIGPHRDDFEFLSEGGSITPFSSRGELRSQILGLKTLELEYLTNNGDAPILLLDDVLSELDDQRKIFLLNYLGGRFQAFITTTELIGDIPSQLIDLKNLP